MLLLLLLLLLPVLHLLRPSPHYYHYYYLTHPFSPRYALVNNAGCGLAQEGTEHSGNLCVETNTYGPKRVTEAFLPLLDPKDGRIVNLGSGAAGGYVKRLGETDAARDMCRDDITWPEIVAHLDAHLGAEADTMGGYGPSKAALAQYSKIVARENPNITVSCCSPGFIDTAMTKGYGASKKPEEGTVALRQLLFDTVEGNGWYYGSDGVRSPYHFMRNPGEPAYDGVVPF